MRSTPNRRIVSTVIALSVIAVTAMSFFVRHNNSAPASSYIVQGKSLSEVQSVMAEYGVEALTGVETRSFTATRMLEAFQASPRLGLALNWLAGMDERQLDEQIMRIGKRGAAERMAHLFLELHKRQMHVGIADWEARFLPLTQPILADTLGMSHVHANRSFRTLVREGMVSLRDHDICLLDINELAEVADFDAAYLQRPEVPAATREALASLDY